MSVHCKQADLCRFRYSSEFTISRREAIASNYLYQSNQFFGCYSPFRQAANMVFTALIHRATPNIAWKCLNTILFVSRNSQKCISGAYDIQNFLVLVSRGLRLIAVNCTMPNLHFWQPSYRSWLRPWLLMTEVFILQCTL